jgi:hypothetical protein
MTPRTVAPPPTDGTMWRRLLAKVHPDGGGDHDLFIWAQALRESVFGRSADDRATRRRPRSRESREKQTTDAARVPFEAAFDKANGFADLTAQAVRMSDDVDPVHGRLLRLLEDCEEADEGEIGHTQQHQGATYRSLAYIAHQAGLSSQQRYAWYSVAEAVPLAARHAGHIIAKLQEEKQ